MEGLSLCISDFSKKKKKKNGAGVVVQHIKALLGIPASHCGFSSAYRKTAPEQSRQADLGSSASVLALHLGHLSGVSAHWFLPAPVLDRE